MRTENKNLVIQVPRRRRPARQESQCGVRVEWHRRCFSRWFLSDGGQKFQLRGPSWIVPERQQFWPLLVRSWIDSITDGFAATGLQAELNQRSG